jgi:hypothetical protein
MHSQTSKQPLQRWTVRNRRLKTSKTGRRKTQTEKKNMTNQCLKKYSNSKKEKEEENDKLQAIET